MPRENPRFLERIRDYEIEFKDLIITSLYAYLIVQTWANWPMLCDYFSK